MGGGEKAEGKGERNRGRKKKRRRKGGKGKLMKLNPIEFQLFMSFLSPPKRINLACSFPAFLANFQLEQCSGYLKTKQNKTLDGLGVRNACKPARRYPQFACSGINQQWSARITLVTFLSLNPSPSLSISFLQDRSRKQPGKDRE